MWGESRPHRRMGEIATRQHGVIARRQLLELGLGPRSVENDVERGWLHPVHRGVYAVGHRRLTREGNFMAALLACGPQSLLSHRSAAWLWELAPASLTLPEVTVPHGARRHPGIGMHRSRTLTKDDRDIVDAIPVTRVPRTLLDLAAVAPRRIDSALERAERMGIFDLVAIHSLLERCGRHRGAPKLRRALGLYVPLPQTRSELERRFLTMIASAGLPRPAVNAVVAGHEVDVLWSPQRLVVELD